MPPDRTERRLVAIVFTDIVGYTALMAESEARGHRVRVRIGIHVGDVVAREGGLHGDGINKGFEEAGFPGALRVSHEWRVARGRHDAPRAAGPSRFSALPTRCSSAWRRRSTGETLCSSRPRTSPPCSGA